MAMTFAGLVRIPERGHRPWCHVDTEFIEVSPRKAIRELLAKVTGG